MDTIYSNEELEELFNDTVYPHILNTGAKIAAYYKHKHKEDYEDILQLISMDVWRVLERLLLIADNKLSFTRLLTSAVNFSFRTHYGKLKKTVYIPNQNTINIDEFECTSVSDVNKLNILIDMSNVHQKIMSVSKQHNRFTGLERDAIEFCLSSLLIGRDPGKKIIAAFYNMETNEANFCIDYSRYLIRMSISSIHNSMTTN